MVETKQPTHELHPALGHNALSSVLEFYTQVIEVYEFKASEYRLRMLALVQSVERLTADNKRLESQRPKENQPEAEKGAP
jgi:hypothetical protein